MNVINELRQARPHRIVDFDLNAPEVVIFNFTEENQDLPENFGDTQAFTNYIFGEMARNGTGVGIGRYNENRVAYARRGLFGSLENPRTVHLGIDLWVAPGTPIRSPFNARVHSFQVNVSTGDYGPTIILEHDLNGVRFYTLYGHLTLDSLSGLHEGMEIEAGQEFCRIGNYPTNGDWPPHLHFQIMTDMRGMRGDFPGVCSIKDREEMLKICIDPNLLLRIKKLEM